MALRSAYYVNVPWQYLLLGHIVVLIGVLIADSLDLTAKPLPFPSIKEMLLEVSSSPSIVELPTVPDSMPPDTMIRSITDGSGSSVAEGDSTESTSAMFTFSGTDDIAIAKYEGSLDKNSFVTITSPVTLNDLPIGTHSYTIRAVDTSGNVDSSPATFTWTVSSPSGQPAIGSGIYVPLYVASNAQIMSSLASEHPGVNFVVAINPCSGPDSFFDQDVYDAINLLKQQQNVQVIGYIPTNYGTQEPKLPSICHPTGERTLAYMKQLVDRYLAWYPQIDGLILDEAASSYSTNVYSFYDELVGYARSNGLNYIMANPGNRIEEQYVPLFDNISILEGQSYPSEPALQSSTFNGKYPKDKFSVVLHNIPTLDTNWVNNVGERYLGLMYVTNDSGSNPYDIIPPYLGQLATNLS